MNEDHTQDDARRLQTDWDRDGLLEDSFLWDEESWDQDEFHDGWSAIRSRNG